MKSQTEQSKEKGYGKEEVVFYSVDVWLDISNRRTEMYAFQKDTLEQWLLYLYNFDEFSSGTVEHWVGVL